MKIARQFQRPWVRAILKPVTQKQLQLLPILAAVRTYDRACLNRDGRAAILVALLAIPQGLAFALIAGLPPAHGVYASIAGLALGSIFSGGRFASFGPSITIAVLLMSTFVQLDISPSERAEVVTLLLVLSALLLCVGAWFRFALLSRFISRSVSTGFILAASCLVFASQLKHVLGVPVTDTGVFASDLHTTFSRLTDTHWPSLLVASLAAGAYLALAQRARALPAAAVAVIVGAVAAWFLDLGGHPVSHLAEVHERLIPAVATGLRLNWTGVIGSAAFAVALLSHLEVSLIGRSFAARGGERFDANQYMLGLGLANLGNAIVGGMPVSVSLSRTRVNWRHRVATPLSGVLAALYCAALFAGLAPFLDLVPRPALAALAMILATETVSRHYLRVILRAPGSDKIVLFATLVAGLLFRLDIALYLGAGLSIIFFLRRVGVPELSEYGFADDKRLGEMPVQERQNPDISIVHVEGDLFFGAAEIFLEQARRVCEDPNLKVVVLRMRNAHHLDASCALAIEELLRFAEANGRHIIVSGAHREIYRVFRNSGLLDRLGRENFFMDTPSNPTLSTRHALKRAQKLLGGAEANIRIYVDPAKRAASPTA